MESTLSENEFDVLYRGDEIAGRGPDVANTNQLFWTRTGEWIYLRLFRQKPVNVSKFIYGKSKDEICKRMAAS